MITAIKPENEAKYEALFDTAADILRGYKRVRVYNPDLKYNAEDSYTGYYYKQDNINAFELIDGENEIIDLSSFAKALDNYKLIYVRKRQKTDEDGNNLYYDKDGNETTQKTDKIVYVNIEKDPRFDETKGITTLEEYFSWIKDLGNLDRKYTMLPLDDKKYFEINANTRAITIPDEFKKNGIAVQGDDIAEVVYFKINRYYDYIDFNNCEIFIEWETPKASDGTIIKSVSPVYVRDIESAPGYLIFGWAISDLITKTAGTLKFAVRFFEWEDLQNQLNTEGEKILGYSFSTLTAQAVIKPSIGFNPKTDYVNPDYAAGNRIVQRLENGVIAGGVKAGDLVYTINLIDPIYDLEINDGKYAPKVIKVQAYSEDTGHVSYSWKKQSIDENTASTPVSGAISTIDGINVYEPVSNNELGIHYVYYEKKQDADGKDIYIATPYNGVNKPENDNIQLYAKCSSISVDEAGIYWAVAENRLSNSVSYLDSNKAVFARPSAINLENGDLAVSGNILDGDETLELKVTPTNDDGILSYQWYYNANKDIDFTYDKDEIEKIDSNWTKPDGAINSSSFTPALDSEGHYAVKITNSRNNDEKFDFSSAARVTKKATPSDIQPIGSTIFYLTNLKGDNVPQIQLDNNNYDYYDVSWTLVESSYNEDDKLEVTEIPNIVTIEVPYGKDAICKFDPNLYEDQIKNASFGKDLTGRYYPVVTKYYNGTTAVSQNAKDENGNLIEGKFFTISE